MTKLAFVLLAAVQDLEAVRTRAEALFEEAKTAYQGARERNSAQGFVEAGFKLEDARIKYIVLAEIGTPEKQKLATERLRAVAQLQKLINDGKAAVMKPPPVPEAEAAPPVPAEPAPKTAVPPADVTARAAVPSATAEKEARGRVRDLFKDRYARKTAGERRELARELLRHAEKTSDDATARWALLAEARALAAEAGDVNLTGTACEAVARHYDADGTPLKLASYAEAAKAARSVEEFENLATAYLELLDDQVANDDYDGAEKAASLASQHARKANDAGLSSRIAVRAKEIAEAKSKYKSMKSVMEKLAKNGDDPASNLEMGQFLCFVKGSWDLGLRFLIKGSDVALKAAAEKDLAFPKDAATTADAGDLWFDLAQKEKGPLKKAQLQSRSRSLYEEALDGASGLTRIRVEKRLDELGKGALPQGAVDLLALIDLKKDAVLGDWTLSGGVLTSPLVKDYARAQIPYVPPEEYDLEIAVRREGSMEGLSIGLVGGGRQFLLTVDGKHYQDSRLIHPIR